MGFEQTENIKDANIQSPKKAITLYLCILIGLFSSASVVMGFIIQQQHHEAYIPKGMITKIENTKGGKKIWLDSKEDYYLFPNSVIYLKNDRLNIKLGDSIQKNKGSYVYNLNNLDVSSEKELCHASFNYPIIIYETSLFLLLSIIYFVFFVHKKDFYKVASEKIEISEKEISENSDWHFITKITFGLISGFCIWISLGCICFIWFTVVAGTLRIFVN